ncbi:uncharacterized protein LOC5503492 isoform X2 [Nematostella vectensis]|uniref:uncharacterized protein LOC5503492 isoform X2 n=1 Tax=Nematostella vectensis TaxID=45351 RepID=UPI0020779B12|nr:uncharacterized protein LOC5503492 isoform X2 [Nematostella vectensis]
MAVKCLFEVLLFVVKFSAVLGYKNQGLTLGNGDRIDINTSLPSATVIKNGHHETYHMTLEHSNFTGPGPRVWSHSTAVLAFRGDIILGEGSVVTVSGRNGLSVRSIIGSVRVSTSVNMTCAVDATGQGTCLGGYTPEYPELIYLANTPGRGPGVNVGYYGEPCLPDCDEIGAGHGGKGANAKSSGGVTMGWFYGRHDIKQLIGGSTGTYKTPVDQETVTRPGSGGGAVEFRAEKGSITIASKITASAQKMYGPNEIHTGSSGGTIRLLGDKICITDKGRLEADGASAGILAQPNPSGGLTGGSGGVIQLISRVGFVATHTISLRAGGNFNCDDSKYKVEHGFFLVADPGGAFNMSWSNASLPLGNVSWGLGTSCEFLKAPTPTSKASSTMNPDLASAIPKPIPGVTSTLEGLRRKALDIKENLNLIDEVLLVADIRSLTRKFQSLVNWTSMTGPQIMICLDIMASLRDIHVTVARGTSGYLKEMTTTLFQLTNSLYCDKNQEAWFAVRELPKLVDTMETVAMTTARVLPEHEILFAGSLFMSQTKTFSSRNFEGIVLPSTGGNYGSEAVIPNDVIGLFEGNLSVIIQIYKDVREKIKSQDTTNTSLKVINEFITCSLLANQRRVVELKAPVMFHFYTKESMKETGDRICVYWNKTYNSWATDGVTLVSNATNTTHAQCKTHHLTSFAVLTQFKGYKISPRHVLALDVITFIGCGMSIATLFITLLVFSAIESLSTDRHRIHMNLALSILLSQSLFLLGINATRFEVLCRIVALMLHYLFSASFTWMCIEGFHLYMKIVTVFGAEGVKLKYYYIFGWGFPAIMVGVAASVDSSGYGTRAACWLSMDKGFIWAFLGPVVAIILVNCVILSMVVKIVMTSSASQSEPEYRQILAGVKGALVLLPLLGITWVFGLLAVTKETVVFQYVFAISNSLQGFCIFIFQCIGNSEVRAAIRRFRQKHSTTDLHSTVSMSQVDTRNILTPKGKRRVSKMKEKVAYKVSRSTAKVLPVKDPDSVMAKPDHPPISKLYSKELWDRMEQIDTNSLNIPQDTEMITDWAKKDSAITRRHSKPSST